MILLPLGGNKGRWHGTFVVVTLAQVMMSIVRLINVVPLVLMSLWISYIYIYRVIVFVGFCTWIIISNGTPFHGKIRCVYLKLFESTLDQGLFGYFILLFFLSFICNLAILRTHLDVKWCPQEGVTISYEEFDMVCIRNPNPQFRVPFLIFERKVEIEWWNKKRKQTRD